MRESTSEVAEVGHESSQARRSADTMWHKLAKRNKGQNLIEYAVIVAIVSAAMVAMSTYVFRSVQSTQQMIQDGFTQ